MAGGTDKSRIDLAFEPNFTLGGLEVHPATREVVAKAGREVLEPRVMQVLVAFARRRGEVVRRDDLTDSCWDGRVVSDDAVNRCVAAIRKLAATHGGFKLETIPRLGHRLLEVPAEVSPRCDETPAPSDEPRPRPLPAAVRSTFAIATAWFAARWRWVAGALVLMLLIALVATLWPQRQPEQTLLVTPPPRLSIAVLPFTPLYSDPDAQNLGDSVATATADMLSSGTRFVIVAPVKSFQFRGAGKAKAAQALHADFLIDGEVRRGNGTVEASFRIIDGSDGTTIHSSTVSRPVGESGSLPDFVATRVAASGWFAAFGFSRNARWDPRVMAAHLRSAGNLAAGDPSTAYEISRRMAAEAPDDAFAQHEHAVVISYLLWNVPPDSRPALLTELRAAEARAIKLDPEYGDPYIVIQFGMPYVEWAEHERLLRKCMAMAPESLPGAWALIRFLHSAGRFGDAEPVLENALARTPYQNSINLRAINSKVWLGRSGEARSLMPRVVAMFVTDPLSFAAMFEATAFNGDLPAAERLLASPAALQAFAPGIVPPFYRQVINALRARKPAEIAAVSKACERIGDRSADIRQTCFLALSALGRRDEAFALAAVLFPDQRGATEAERERRWLAHDYPPSFLLFVPAAAPLRADPRFRDVVERIGLLQYWTDLHRAPDFCAMEKAPVCRILAAR